MSDGHGSPAASPDTLIRTMEGHITSWSPGMEHRYGFTSADALGQKSYQLLRTIFPRALQEIHTTLASRNTWSGGLIHRHADGRPVMTANHWYARRDVDNQIWIVTEAHSDIAQAGNAGSHHIADVLEALAHELSEPLTAIGNYVDGARRILEPGWPDLGSIRLAMARASDQIVRGAEGLRLLRNLAVAVRDGE